MITRSPCSQFHQELFTQRLAILQISTCFHRILVLCIRLIISQITRYSDILRQQLMPNHFSPHLPSSPGKISLISQIEDIGTHSYLEGIFIDVQAIGVAGIIYRLLHRPITLSFIRSFLRARIPMECCHRIIPFQFAQQAMTCLPQFHVIKSPVALQFQHIGIINLGDIREIIIGEIILHFIAIYLKPLGIEQIEIGGTS